jgi:ABC-2 type transport system ATP-binding protein
MSHAMRTVGLAKRYGRRDVLSDCTLEIPTGRVVGLVGPNGAGKTTLLQLAVGLITPTSGTIEVLGGRPDSGVEQLAKVGFVAQDAPTYAGLSVADHLRLGARLNPGWDADVAARRVADLGLDPSQKAGSLSGGQRAQLALTVAVAKRPELLILDEPTASLDPLARRDFLASLMAYTADGGASVVLSSHLVSDLERVCDYLIILSASRILVAGDVDELLGTHYRVTGPPLNGHGLPSHQEVVDASHTDRQSTFVLRSNVPVDDPSWSVEPVGLEDLVLAYMAGGGTAAAATREPALGARR